MCSQTLKLASLQALLHFVCTVQPPLVDDDVKRIILWHGDDNSGLGG